jgi:hypothetical protein
MGYFMGEKEGLSSKARQNAIGEELDALSGRIRKQRAPSATIRRAMEASIEAKSKKRRSTQPPTSSGWKSGAT